MKTHIPGANGRTYCGRAFWNVAPGSPAVAVIDTSRACIEDATCAACHRVDNRMQAEAYQSDRAVAMFAAACRWAAREGLTWLHFNPRARCAAAGTEPDLLGCYWVRRRTLEDLELDAQDAGTL